MNEIDTIAYGKAAVSYRRRHDRHLSDQTGHNETVITSSQELYATPGYTPRRPSIYEYDHLKTYDHITSSVATGISDGKVSYIDANGKKESINTNDVVIYGGLKEGRLRPWHFTIRRSNFSPSAIASNGATMIIEVFGVPTSHRRKVKA